MRCERGKALGVGLDILLVVQLLADDHVEQRVEERDIGPDRELQHVGRVPLQRLAARVHDDQRRATLGRLLEIGRRDRMVLGRVGADHHDDVGLFTFVEGRSHRARADPLHQGGDRRGMAQPRAVIDIVVAEAGAHEFLEQVGFLIRALGRAEAGKRMVAVLCARGLEPVSRAIERLLPARRAEMRPRITGISRVVRALADAVLADQRLRQPMRMVHVVEAEAALHAQPVLVRRAVPARDVKQPVVLDVIGQLAPHPAIRAYAVDHAIGVADAPVVGIEKRCRHQRAGGTGLHAFAAGDAGRSPHRIVEVEHDLFGMAAAGHADHVVDLHLAAGADAQSAVNAGVEIDRHRRMTAIGGRRLARGEAARGDAYALGPAPKGRCRIVRPVLLVCSHFLRRTAPHFAGKCSGLARGLIGHEQFEHHAPRRFHALRRGRDGHACGRRANAARSQHALACDLDHASAAIAVGPVPGRRRIAQMRDVDAEALGDLPDGLARPRLDRSAVEGEGDRRVSLGRRAQRCALAIACGLGTALLGLAVVHRHDLRRFIHQLPSPRLRSSGKYRNTDKSGLGAA